MQRIISTLLLLCSLGCYAQFPGDSIFNSNQLIHEIRINFPISTWYDTLTKYYNLSEQTDSSVYFMASSVEFDGVSYDSVGCKFKGNSSYNNPSQKKSWKLDFEEFKEDNEVNGLKQFNLNNGFKDPTLLREKLCLDFLRRYGIPAPRCDYANVYVNNALWGFYTLVEEVDKTFCKTHFDNKSGNLFKGDPHGDLRWKGGTASNYYSDYELKTNEDINDWSDLLWLIDNVNNTSTADYNDSLNICLNTSSYIKSWASTILFSNLDSYSGSGHNYYIYHNVDSNRFEWINWDVNEAFGVFLNGNSLNGMTTLPLDYIPTQGNRPLNSQMIANATYWNEYRNFLCNVTVNYFNNTVMDPIIDSLYARIQPSFNADPHKLFTSTQSSNNITSTQSNALGLKPFIQERHDYITQQLSGFTCSALPSVVKSPSADLGLIAIYPNPATDNLFITGIPDGAAEVSIYDNNGRRVRAQKVFSSMDVIDIQSLLSGIYFVEINQEGALNQLRFVKSGN